METSQLRNKPIFKPNALLKFISILSCFAICIEHGYDPEKTQIEIGNTFHYSRQLLYKEYLPEFRL